MHALRVIDNPHRVDLPIEGLEYRRIPQIGDGGFRQAPGSVGEVEHRRFEHGARAHIEPFRAFGKQPDAPGGSARGQSCVLSCVQHGGSDAEVALSAALAGQRRACVHRQSLAHTDAVAAFVYRAVYIAEDGGPQVPIDVDGVR